MRAVRLLAGAALHFRRAHRHAGAIHSQVHGGNDYAHSFHAAAFVVGDFGAQRFGGPLHLADADLHSRQLVQQRTTLLEAPQYRRAACHAQNSRCERKQLQPQSAVARAESTLAPGAVIVGPLQTQRPQHAFKRLLVTAPIPGRFSAGARQFRTGMIGSVGVQTLFQCSCGQPQSLVPRRHLHGFEIQIGNCQRT